MPTFANQDYTRIHPSYIPDFSFMYNITYIYHIVVYLQNNLAFGLFTYQRAQEEHYIALWPYLQCNAAYYSCMCNVQYVDPFSRRSRPIYIVESTLTKYIIIFDGKTAKAVQAFEFKTQTANPPIHNIKNVYTYISHAFTIQSTFFLCAEYLQQPVFGSIPLCKYKQPTVRILIYIYIF